MTLVCINNFYFAYCTKGVHLIRYVGFLANRVRAKLLPLVCTLFFHHPNPKKCLSCGPN